LYYQAKAPSSEKNENDQSSSNMFVESQEAGYLRECLKEQNQETSQIKMFKQSLENKFQANRPLTLNTMSNEIGQDYSKINVSL
jgi:hypothetical protein